MPKGIPRNKCAQQAILHRLKIARGHLNKVIGMVEGGSYCIDIIHQSIAVQSALKSADEALLKNHMETCVADEIRKGNTKEAIEEVMKVVEKKQHE
jgi:DNA-binding FrmR family transcriptional regulator